LPFWTPLKPSAPLIFLEKHLCAARRSLPQSAAKPAPTPLYPRISLLLIPPLRSPRDPQPPFSTPRFARDPPSPFPPGSSKLPTGSNPPELASLNGRTTSAPCRSALRSALQGRMRSARLLRHFPSRQRPHLRGLLSPVSPPPRAATEHLECKRHRPTNSAQLQTHFTTLQLAAFRGNTVSLPECLASATARS
jgi:hypothetical protein